MTRSIAHYVDQGHDVASARVLASLKPGDVVRHVDHGPVTVVRIPRNGAIVVRCHDNGIEGTVSPLLLRRYA